MDDLDRAVMLEIPVTGIGALSYEGEESWSCLETRSRETPGGAFSLVVVLGRRRSGNVKHPMVQLSGRGRCSINKFRVGRFVRS